MNRPRIAAGIVLFHPEINRLIENVKAIENQVDQIILFDNGGIIHNEILSTSKKTKVLGNGTNVGIAKALNEICKYADTHLYEWVLTLDQDSVVSENIITNYIKYTELNEVAVLCPKIIDRNITTHNDNGPKYEYVDFCITSASMVRIEAWKRIGGFWEDLFIDMVDFDFSWSLIKSGYKILRINTTSILHEIGHGKTVSFKGKEDAVYNHSSLRCYYIARNSIAVGKRHHRLKQCTRWVCKRMYLITRYESNRLQKLHYMFKGVFDGIFGNLGECKVNH